MIAGGTGTAYITGSTSASSVVINGGSVQFANAGNELLTAYNFSMNAGTLKLTVDATALNWNTITSNAGSITLTNPCSVTVNTINIPAGGMPHRKWNIFFASNTVPDNSVEVGTFVNFGYTGFTYTGRGGNGTINYYLQS